MPFGGALAERDICDVARRHLPGDIPGFGEKHVEGRQIARFVTVIGRSEHAAARLHQDEWTSIDKREHPARRERRERRVIGRLLAGAGITAGDELRCGDADGARGAAADCQKGRGIDQ